jgi:hypothetical protein
VFVPFIIRAMALKTAIFKVIFVCEEESYRKFKVEDA